MKYTGDVFKKFNNDKYSRVDALHKLDFFYGKDEKGNASLLLQTSCKVEVLPSTNCIVVETGWRTVPDMPLQKVLRMQILWSHCKVQ